MNWNKIDRARSCFAPRHTGVKGMLPNWFCDANQIPFLSKEGKARSAGVVCSKTRSYLIDGRKALLINRYCSPLNRPPQPSLREGIPALLRRGISCSRKNQLGNVERVR